MSIISQWLSEMVLEFGKLTLLLSYVLLVPMARRVYGSNRETVKSRTRLFQVHWILMLLSLILLLMGFIISDPDIAYVVLHSDPSMPLYYRMSALWGGHSGSLLLMLTMLATYVMWVVLYAKRLVVCLKQYAMVMGGLLSILIFFNNPFLLYQGNEGFLGLNPLLQDFGMMIHPPILYLGYCASVVPFLIVLAQPHFDKVSSYWLKLSSQFSLGVLTIGIILGSWWAYRILGWGGYWAWDPVENASLLPWLLQLALYHAVIAKHEVMVKWLALCGFCVTMVATGLVRSGAMVSVHSFMSNDIMLYTFSVMVALLSVWACYHRRNELFSHQLVSGPMVLHYWWVLLAAAFLLFSLILPVVFDLMGQSLVLNELFFVKVMRYVAVGVLFSMGSYLSQYIRYLMVGGIAIMLFVGYAGQYSLSSILVSVILCLVLGLLLGYLYLGYRNLGHIGFIFMLGFICLNHLQSTSYDMNLMVGENYMVHSHHFQLVEIQDHKTTQYIEKKARIRVDNEWLSPAIRYFPKNDVAVAISDVVLHFNWEWYVVMGAMIEEGVWSVSLYKQYWVRWIWVSGMIMLAGFWVQLPKSNRNKKQKVQYEDV